MHAKMGGMSKPRRKKPTVAVVPLGLTMAIPVRSGPSLSAKIRPSIAPVRANMAE